MTLRRQVPVHLRNSIRAGIENARDEKPVSAPGRTADPRKHQSVAYEDRPFDLIAGQVLALSPARFRSYLLVQNNSSTDMFLSINKGASVRGIKIPAGGNYEPFKPPSGTLSVTSPAGGSGVLVEG